ncbi:hypothetical protein T439DRAFT_175325 [Meredithblackwellia eburnea MCA 4105]
MTTLGTTVLQGRHGRRGDPFQQPFWPEGFDDTTEKRKKRYRLRPKDSDGNEIRARDFLRQKLGRGRGTEQDGGELSESEDERGVDKIRWRPSDFYNHHRIVNIRKAAQAVHPRVLKQGFKGQLHRWRGRSASQDVPKTTYPNNRAFDSIRGLSSTFPHRPEVEHRGHTRTPSSDGSTTSTLEIPLDPQSIGSNYARAKQELDTDTHWDSRHGRPLSSSSTIDASYQVGKTGDWSDSNSWEHPHSQPKTDSGSDSDGSSSASCHVPYDWPGSSYPSPRSSVSSHPDRSVEHLPTFSADGRITPPMFRRAGEWGVPQSRNGHLNSETLRKFDYGTSSCVQYLPKSPQAHWHPNISHPSCNEGDTHSGSSRASNRNNNDQHGEIGVALSLSKKRGYYHLHRIESGMRSQRLLAVHEGRAMRE